MNNTLDQSKASVKRKISIRTIKKPDSPWDAGILAAKRKISELRFTIRDFEKRKKRGDKWLGDATQSPSA